MRNKKSIIPSISKKTIADFYKAFPSEKIICKAPFSSLYFHPDGEVGACCLNKNEYFYGHYNQDSLNEIIKSESRNRHQKHLKANNFNLGCKVCENSLIAKNYSGLLANIYQKFSTNKRIERLDFELSYYCNFDCIMCQRDKSDNISKIYDDSFIEDIKPLLKKLKFANFLGGEPFIIPIYFKIWDYLIKNNPKCMITVQSNGSIYNNKVELLLRHVNFHVGISIDSLKKETFEHIRKNSSFEKVIKNCEIFGKQMALKGSNLQISACPLRINYIDILEIVKFANKNQYEIFFNQVFTPRELNLRDLSSEKLSEILDFYKQSRDSLSNETNIEKKNNKAFDDLISLIFLWYKNAIERERDTEQITKSELITLIKTYQPDFFKKNSVLIIQALSKIPEEFLCTKEQLEQIKHFDYNVLLVKNSDDEIDTNNIAEQVKSFFYLNK